MEIRFDRLNLAVVATETLPLGGFAMHTILTWCGTAGCVIGNYNELVHRSPHEFAGADFIHFGITRAEYEWLFCDAATLHNKYGKVTWHTKPRRLYTVTREQALSRLRKFIAYKRRKHEMLHDPKYGIRDEARRAEGNQNFVMLAVADTAKAMASLATAT